MVLVNRDVYVNHIQDILKDNTKFENVDVKIRTFKLHVNHEKRINEILKSLKSTGGLSNKQYKKIKRVGSRPGVLYGLCKVHKAIVDVLPPFRHALSAIGTPTYKITRLLMNSLLKTLFRLQKKLLNKTVAFIWVAYMWIHFLPTFHLKKPLTSAQNQYMIKMIVLKV